MTVFETSLCQVDAAICIFVCCVYFGIHIEQCLQELDRSDAAGRGAFLLAIMKANRCISTQDVAPNLKEIFKIAIIW